MASVTYELMEPSVPAGTIAAFATTLASNEFKVDTSGVAPPAGQSVRYASVPGGTTVALRLYACANDDIPQALPGTGHVLVSPGPSVGPPNVPAAPRVSDTRHGVTE